VVEFYLQEMQRCKGEEEQRAAQGGGKRADGKKISKRPDLKVAMRVDRNLVSACQRYFSIYFLTFIEPQGTQGWALTNPLRHFA